MKKYSFPLYLFIYLLNHNFIKSLNNSKSDFINLEFISKDNKNSEKKNLIIGAIINDEWNMVKIFFKSYQKAGFKNCDCIMFVSDVSEETIDEIKSCGVIVYPIPEEYKKGMIIKWKIYEDYLSKNQDKYKLVFTSDIRGVVFQSDLFQLYDLNKPYLGIAIEDGTLTDTNNRNWIIETYDEITYQNIKNERIFCVGSAWGTTDKFIEFSKAMWNRLSSNSSKKLGVEQAISNYIIYYEKMFDNCLIRSHNTNGYIMSIELTNPGNIILNIECQVLNGQGEVAAVVQQYDRHASLKKLIEYKYNSDNQSFQSSKLTVIIIIIIIIDIIVVIIVIYIWKKKFNTKPIDINNSKIEMVKIPKNETFSDDEEIKDKTKLIKEQN